MFTLHNDDCLQVLPSIPNGSIDAIITDLPYGTTACKWDTVIPFEPMWKEVKRVLKPSGAFITTASQPFTSALIMSNPKWFNCEWIWHKSKPSGIAFTNQPMRNHENVVVFGNIKTFNAILEEREGFTEKSIKRFSSGENLGTYRNHGNSTNGLPLNELKKINKLRKPTTIKKFGSIANRLGTLHPTQKPVALYEYLIKTYTNEGETVLDIAMGSGTTIEAAERTGRNSIGIEKDEGIFQSAVLRLKPFTPSNNRLHMDAGDSPRLPSQSTLEGFTPAEQGSTPAPRQ